MTTTHTVTLCAALLLTGCATLPPDPPALPDLPHEPPAVTLPAPDPLPPVPTYDVVLPPPDLQIVAPPPPQRGKPSAPSTLLTPRHGGQRDPDSHLLTYPYRPGALYLVTASPRHPVTLLLPLGVRLSSPPTLNTAQDDSGEWNIGRAKIGEDVGDDYQEAITLRPRRAGITATTPLPTKTGQVFLVRLQSQDKPGDLLVTWDLPVGSLQRVRTKGDTEPAQLVRHAPPPAINRARLHSRYLIERGEKPVAWLPVEAYDDGSLTVIRFVESLSYTRAPQLVRVSPDRKKPLPLEYTAYRVPGEPGKGEFFIARGIHPRLRLLDGTGAWVDILRVEDTAHEPH